MQKFIHCFSGILLSICIIQCSSTSTVHITYNPPVSSHSNVLLAGAAKADITPPPGMPLAGYSSNAQYANGFRTRLYARVIYLKSGSNAVAIVACDLLSGSSLVQKKVAELVANTTDVSYSGIMIAGTHTHSGPGNYFESIFYNRFASNASGFDEEYFTFLCNQIADAIINAYSSRKPAILYYGSKTLYGYTRNRSIQAYKANPNSSTDNPLKAINPVMHMLRIDSIGKAGTKPLAALTIFSIHGTAVPDTNTLYSGDIFAYIERELEWEMQRNNSNNFVHAVCNGTHADNAPNIIKGKQGFAEARRAGIQIGQAAISLYKELQNAPVQSTRIHSILKEIDVYSNPAINDARLCVPPKVGNTLLAGASDGGPTPVLSSMPFFKEGSRSCIPCGCHKQKIVAGSLLQPLILPKNDFPHLLTFQAITVGSVCLLPVPFEVTYQSGTRIAASARGSDPIIPIVISCANGYTGYCTTPEEYTVQRYEGGHTLYGPYTQPFLAYHYAQLLENIYNYAGDSYWEKSYTFTAASFIKKHPLPHIITRKAVAQPVYIVNPGIDETYVEFSFQDAPPEYMEFHKPLVYIEYSTDGKEFKPFKINGIVVDDTGYDIAVLFTGTITKDGLARYTVRLYNPALLEKTFFRFVILPRNNASVLYSEVFSW